MENKQNPQPVIIFKYIFHWIIVKLLMFFLFFFRRIGNNLLQQLSPTVQSPWQISPGVRFKAGPGNTVCFSMGSQWEYLLQENLWLQKFNDAAGELPQEVPAWHTDPPVS